MKMARRMKLTAGVLGSIALLLVAADAVAEMLPYSINMVGSTKITCPRGKTVLASMPFESPRGTPMHSSELFGSQLPIGTRILVFDAQEKTFIVDTRMPDEWDRNITHARGNAFWINVPANAPNPIYTLALLGQVPANPSVTNVLTSGLQLLGNPYPAAQAWTNTALAKCAREGDELFIMNADQPPRGYRYTVTDGWGAASNLVIGAGMGFWYRTSGNLMTNVEARPYLMPSEY